jgi:hypothetical protein
MFLALVFEKETSVSGHHIRDEGAVFLDFGLQFRHDLQFDLGLRVFDGLDDVVVEASELV